MIMKVSLDLNWHDVVRIVEENGYMVVPEYIMKEVTELRERLEAEKREKNDSQEDA